LARSAYLLTLVVALAAGVSARGDDPPPAKDGDALQKALQARLDAAQKIYDVRLKEYQAGKATGDLFFQAQKQLLMAQLDMRDKKADRVAIYEKNRDRAAEAKKIADAKGAAGVISIADQLQAEYELRDAEVLLEREKGK
jgi:outer membrane protein TolC